MSVAKKILMGSGAVDDYEIEQSLMFARGDGAYLHRTPGSASNRRTWTWSTWFKKGAGMIDNGPVLFSAAASSPSSDADYFSVGMYDDGDAASGGLWVNSNSDNWIDSSHLMRDFGGWYHIVVILDTTDSTAGDRVKLYINGARVTSFVTSANPAEDAELAINNTLPHWVGGSNLSGYPYYADCYFAEMHFIDGTAVAASAFGKTDSDTNQWVPIEYTGGSYGTNGFYLKFESGALGTDSSGEGNNFTAVNLADSDVMLDTPSNNFPTINPLTNCTSSSGNGGGNTITQGNLRISGQSDNNGASCAMAIPSSGKWYYEFGIITLGQAMQFGIYAPGNGTATELGAGTSTVPGWHLYQVTNGAGGGSIYGGDSPGYWTYGDNLAAGDILGVAVDMDNGAMYFAKNNTWQASGDPTSGASKTNAAFTDLLSTGYTWVVGAKLHWRDAAGAWAYNAGQNSSFAGTETAQGNADGNGIGDFYYTPPSGYLALCQKNLSAPTIALPEEYFNTVLWTGADTSAAKSVTGVGFQPDFVWSKSRSDAYNWNNEDAVRGANKRLSSNTTSEESPSSSAGYLSAFDSDGFTTTAGSTDNANWNKTSSNYVAWNWLAGTAPTADNSAGAGATPTAGSVKIDGSNLGSALAGTIAATRLSANTTSAFSITKYTGNSTAGATVAHGLGVAPDLVIIKNLTKTSDTGRTWDVTSPVLGTTGDTTGGLDEYYMLVLNTTAAKGDYGEDNIFGFTSTTFSVGSAGNMYEVNNSSYSYVAYCFADVAGYSKVGSYIGNGNADGSFVYTGFRPAWLLIKNTSNAQDWILFDNKRDPFNVTQQFLYPNLTAAEAAGGATVLDMLSNGFKLRGTTRNRNYSSDVYLYMAFAEFPFKYANAR